jgi:hypothetical protein
MVALRAAALLAITVRVTGCGRESSDNASGSTDWTLDQAAAALREQGLRVEVIGLRPESTCILPASGPRLWRVAVFVSREAADRFVARFAVHPANMMRRGNVLATPTSSRGSLPDAVAAAP